MDTQNTPNAPDAAPQGMERRMVLRLLSHWRQWCGDNQFPSFTDVNPVEMAEIWDYCFVLDFVGYEDDPIVRTVGDKLQQYMSEPIRNCLLSEVPPRTLIENAAGYYQEIFSRGVPISRGGEFVKYDGMKVLFRSIIMPMSDDGVVVSGLLGAANCREVPNE
ncbi:MAG: PAS domain-containing protein [Alphaproteobacteria bacterium]